MPNTLIDPSYAVAHAAATEEANRQMRKEGRIAWNHDDANLAAVTFRRIWGIYEDEREQHEMQVYTEFD